MQLEVALLTLEISHSVVVIGKFDRQKLIYTRPKALSCSA